MTHVGVEGLGRALEDVGGAPHGSASVVCCEAVRLGADARRTWLQAEPGSKLLLGRVLALKESGEFHVGRPYLEDVRVEADVMEELKAPKVVIFKMRAKKHYRRKTGHRQPLTKFLITKIERA